MNNPPNFDPTQRISDRTQQLGERTQQLGDPTNQLRPRRWRRLPRRSLRSRRPGPNRIRTKAVATRMAKPRPITTTTSRSSSITTSHPRITGSHHRPTANRRWLRPRNRSCRGTASRACCSAEPRRPHCWRWPLSSRRGRWAGCRRRLPTPQARHHSKCRFPWRPRRSRSRARRGGADPAGNRPAACAQSRHHASKPPRPASHRTTRLHQSAPVSPVRTRIRCRPRLTRRRFRRRLRRRSRRRLMRSRFRLRMRSRFRRRYEKQVPPPDEKQVPPPVEKQAPPPVTRSRLRHR